MSLWTKIQSLWLGGVDTAEEQQRQNELDGAITASNQNLVNNGTWTQAQYDAAQADLAKSDTPDIQGAVDAAYVQGAQEGLAADATFFGKLSSAVNSLLKGAIKDALGAIPWQLWVIGAIALFIYLGGLGIIRRQIKNAS